MKALQNVLRILLYLSIGFVVYYLFTFDFVIFDKLTINWALLGLSVILLWAGFVMSTMSWKVILAEHRFQIKPTLAIYSHGISVFAKYMPGKIWVILGRASLVSEETGSMAQLSTISLKEQFVYLFMGIVISLIILPFVQLNLFLLILVFLTATGLGLFLFFKPVHHLVLKIISRVTNRKFEVPFLSISQVARIAWAIFLYWFLWSLGFYFLVLSIMPSTSILVAFIFPASVCFGLLAIFFPGGIGVREGIIVILLKGLGVEPELAITISILQRLWFVSGEIFIFGLAFLIRKLRF